MRKNRIIYFLLVLYPFILLLSCSEDVVTSVNDKKGTVQTKVILNEVGRKDFLLDSVTSPYTPMVQYFEESGKRYFSLLNQYNNTIYVYDYASGEIDSVIPFDVEGPNTIGRLSGYKFHTLDSLYIFSRARKRIGLVNHHRQLVNSFDITLGNLEQGKYYPNPIVETNAPLIKENHNVYFVGYINGEYQDATEHNRKIGLVLNEKSGLIQTRISYPPQYYQANWFGAHFLHVYCDYNASRKEFVYSFPIEHYLYVAKNQEEKFKKVYAGSQHFDAIPSTKQHWFANKSARFEYFATHPSYSSVIYDPYRKYYYRFAQLPLRKEEFKSRPKRISVVILDENFNWLGETILPDHTFDHYIYFVTEEGLHINRYVGQEDLATYTIYNAIEKH